MIIPAYNAAGFIEGNLEKILRGSGPEVEVLVVDDGSTDNTLARVRAVKNVDSRVQTYSQPHRGVAPSRNRGILHARGKYVLFVDADDYVNLPLILAEVLPLMESGNLDLALFDTVAIFSPGIEAGIQRKMESHYRRNPRLGGRVTTGERLGSQLIRAKSFTFSACLIVWRRALVLEAGIRFPSESSLEDQTFVIEVFSSAQQAVYVPVVAHRRLVRPGSRSRNLKFEEVARSHFHSLRTAIWPSLKFGTGLVWRARLTILITRQGVSWILAMALEGLRRHFQARAQ